MIVRQTSANARLVEETSAGKAKGRSSINVPARVTGLVVAVFVVRYSSSNAVARCVALSSDEDVLRSAHAAAKSSM
jgi:hypothetical protein